MNVVLSRHENNINLIVVELMFLICGAGETFWESLGLQGDQSSQS